MRKLPNAVIFDLFGTIVPYLTEDEFRSSLAATAEIMGISHSKLVAAWCNEGRFLEWVTMPTSTEDRIRKTFAEFGLRPTEGQIAETARTRLDAHRRWMLPRETSVEILTKLKSIGIRLGRMSVCSGEVREIWEETPFNGLFDVVHLSCELGMDKSQETFYRKTLDKLEADPTRTIYVGDSAEELEWASRLGMRAILMKSDRVQNWNLSAIDEPIELLLVEEFE